MQRYNDYIRLTREYLENFREFEVAAENLAAEIQTTNEIHEAEVAAPISNYSGLPGGGSGELTTVENFAARREELCYKIMRLKNDYREISLRVEKIKRAIAALGDEERYIVEQHYIFHRGWVQVATKGFCSVPGARQRGKKAVRKIALMIFGQKAWTDNNFNFVA